MVPFVSELDPRYGAVVEVAPDLRRLVANNPSKYAYLGTGTYIVGRGSVAIIDCGPRDDAHAAALLAALAGETVTHLLVTHTHGDHSPGTAAVKAATGATSYGFGPHPVGALAEGTEDGDDEAPEMDPEEAAKNRPDVDFVPDVTVTDGDVIEGPGFRVECLHTPGHISNHLCFSIGDRLFTGDHVMGWSTTVIPPPDGDMGAYLSSLRKLIGRPETSFWPTHGPPIDDPQPFVRALIEHRLARERQILAYLAQGPTTIPDMVKVLYADVRTELHKPASRSVLAHLVPLVREGRIACGSPEPGLKDAYWLP